MSKFMVCVLKWEKLRGSPEFIPWTIVGEKVTAMAVAKTTIGTSVEKEENYCNRTLTTALVTHSKISIFKR